MDMSVVIPVYKNKQEFLKNLKNNLRYLQNLEIIVVNDDPEESIKDDVKQFAKVTLLENSTNIGFGQTVNRGVGKAHGKYILLLNSDVLLQDDSFKKALDHFTSEKNLFGVSFEQVERDGSFVGKNRFYWENGFVNHEKANDLEFGPTGWVEGGSCLLDKEKFQTIGGFDPIYAPFYWEDNDLSYRARKAGYNVLFDPQIRVVHHHESTIGKYFSKDYVKTVAYRNQLIFIWNNITDSKLLRSHIFALILMLGRSIIRGDRVFIKGFWGAVTKFPIILEKRSEQRKYNKLTDVEILLIGK